MKAHYIIEIKKEPYGDDKVLVAYVLVNLGTNTTDIWKLIRMPFENYAKVDTDSVFFEISKPTV